MTAAPLSWHHARAHYCLFMSNVQSADDTVTRRTPRLSYRTDTVAQVTKSTVILSRKDQSGNGQTFVRMTAAHSVTASRTHWCCLCSRQRWRPNQLWAEILWLTSAACAVNAVVRSNSDARWRRLLYCM